MRASRVQGIWRAPTATWRKMRASRARAIWRRTKMRASRAQATWTWRALHTGNALFAHVRKVSRYAAQSYATSCTSEDGGRAPHDVSAEHPLSFLFVPLSCPSHTHTIPAAVLQIRRHSAEFAAAIPPRSRTTGRTRPILSICPASFLTRRPSG